jgi:hypothetical protein
MSKKTLYPDSMIVDYNDGAIGVGELYNTGHGGGVGIYIVTPDGKKKIGPENAKTYGGVIDKKLAEWLLSKYMVILEKVEGGFYIVKYPFEIPVSEQ